jgi:thiamine-phosphate pyrophosphorylase
MHKILPKYYYFIDRFDKNHIKNLDKNIAIIFRRYNKKVNISEIIKIKNFCRIYGRKFLLSNNIRLALKLDLDGVYLPSFNKSIKINTYSKKTNFLVLGSAHNIKDIRIKEQQNIDAIFLASIFSKKKTYLGLNKFKILKSKTKTKVIALGGINKNNLKKLNLLNVYGFAAISFFNKTKKRPLLRGL